MSKNTLSEQVAEVRASVLDLILVIGEPGWKFIKRHPRLYWLWNKSQPLIKVICWFFPINWEE